jgi:hypothetical protein
MDRAIRSLQMGSGWAVGDRDAATEFPVTSGRERRASPSPNRPDRFACLKRIEDSYRACLLPGGAGEVEAAGCVVLTRAGGAFCADGDVKGIVAPLTGPGTAPARHPTPPSAGSG